MELSPESEVPRESALEGFPAAALRPARLQSNPPEVIERHLMRLGYPQEQARAIAAQSAPGGGTLEVFIEGLPEIPGLERIIGKDMIMEVNYLEAGHIAARAVGRVLIRNGQAGFGTGFLVSPRLLLTNNHVLPNREVAAASRVEFNFQRNLDGAMAQSVVFDIDPDTLFVTSPLKELDFALVAIRDRSPQGEPLSNFGHHPLTALQDEVLAGQSVTIIQHPKGDPKQIALRENEVIKLPDSGERFLHYQTDTHPGSSGSPVFNDAWDVVALHHAGKPDTDEQGNPKLVDGGIWQPGISLDRIKWIANEGIRVAAIVKFVREQDLSEDQKTMVEEALKPRSQFEATRDIREIMPAPRPSPRPIVRPGDGRKPDTIITQATRTADAGSAMQSPKTDRGDVTATTTDDGVVVTIPIQVTVRLGIPQVGPGPSEKLAAEEKIEIDPDYTNREGYDPEFLGTGHLRVPFPRMTPAMEANAAVSRIPHPQGPKCELAYHHFSVVLNKKRRLAYFTAVNIDGRSPRPPQREKDKWIFDPRVGREAQVGDELYDRNLFDRGHLVRRLDPAWGRSMTIAKAANDDTFHFTNCSPQHERFNQGKNLWVGLEDYLLGKAANESQRMSVFTGPVFTNSDPVYRGVAIPRRFWKVAVTTGQDGRLMATAFVVSQEDLIKPVVEEISPAAVAKLFQVRVRKVEELTGLDFGQLHDYDPTVALDVFETTEQGESKLEDYEQIVLG